jgi:hypothetical protein
MVDNEFVGVTCSPVRSFNRYVAASQAKCLFWLLKTFYFPMFTVFLSTCKTPAIFILFNTCIYLVTEDSTTTSVPDNVQSQPTLGRWEDRHVRLLIESYLKFKGLIGQGNNTKKGVFDKIAVEFNKHADIKVTGEQCLRKWKKLETKQKEIEDNNRQTGRAHKTWTRRDPFAQEIFEPRPGNFG